MNDKLLMENYLLLLKSTTEVYVHGTLESSNQDVRNVIKQGLDDIMRSQANTYDEMTKYGWYKVNNIEESKIKQTITSLEQGN